MHSSHFAVPPRSSGACRERLESGSSGIVIIRAADKERVIAGAQVTRMNVKGQATVFQVVGEPEERAKGSGAPGKPAIPIEDVRLVAEKAGVSEEDARNALEECNGEPAEAIVKVTSR